jgi:Flp pilus assembly protein TadG
VRAVSRASEDAGSAVAEFVMVSVLLIGLFAGVVQVGLVLYVRNTLVAAAADGARYAANADRAPGDGAAYAESVIRDALADRFADEVTAGYESVGGTPTVYVQADASLPLLGFWGPLDGPHLTVRGHALDEEGP